MFLKLQDVARSGHYPCHLLGVECGRKKGKGGKGEE